MRTNFLANPIITASEIAPFFFFFALDTVWSSRQSHWLITVPWKIAPWPDGCNISERATQYVWIVNLQLWTLWAFVVLVMAWTLTGKGEKLVGGFFLALIWGDMASSCHAQQTSMRSGSHNSGEKLPSGRSRVQDPVHTLGLRGSVPERCGWVWILGFRPRSQGTIRDLPPKQPQTLCKQMSLSLF